MFFADGTVKALLFVCFVMVCGLSWPAAAIAKTWEEAISDVEAMAEEFWQRAQTKGFNDPLGTAFNEVDVEMHLCAILGRMVGHKDAIAHLEPPQPETDASGREFAIAATSLGNWVIAARYHTSLSAGQKKRIWNLDCVGRMDIPQGLAVAVERGHGVIYDPDRRAIMVQGDITPGFAETVINAIARYPDAKVVSLGSGGGSVYDALEAGLAIRGAGLETELVNGCYSACPLVLAGGVTRFMWWPFEEVGLHQVSLFGIGLPRDHRVYIDIAAYLDVMGVDASWVLQAMYSAPPSGMRIVNEAERCAMRLITNHQRGCLANY